MIYLDLEGKLILIEDIGIFELKETKNKKNKSASLKKQIDIKKNIKKTNQDILDKKSRISQELFFENFEYNFEDNPNINIDFFENISNFKLYRLFELIPIIKSMPYKSGILAKLSPIIDELIVEKEGNLLVLSSKNKNLINIFVEKIATLGYFPINQINLSEGSDILYKFYYEDDSEEDFY